MAGTAGVKRAGAAAGSGSGCCGCPMPAARAARTVMCEHAGTARDARTSHRQLQGRCGPATAGHAAPPHTQGCYIGQETLSKLANLDAVKQQLWGLELEGPATPGSDITDQGGARLGRVTSATTTPEGRHFGLGYVKCKSKGAQVDVEGARGAHDTPSRRRRKPQGGVLVLLWSLVCAARAAMACAAAMVPCCRACRHGGGCGGRGSARRKHTVRHAHLPRGGGGLGPCGGAHGALGGGRQVRVARAWCVLLWVCGCASRQRAPRTTHANVPTACTPCTPALEAPSPPRSCHAAGSRSRPLRRRRRTPRRPGLQLCRRDLKHSRRSRRHSK